MEFINGNNLILLNSDEKCQGTYTWGRGKPKKCHRFSNSEWKHVLILCRDENRWRKRKNWYFQLTALPLLSVNSFLAFYPIALYLLLLTAQPLHPSRSPVVFLRVLFFHLLCFFSSPTLFLLFINDLLHATASDVHSFADDSNLHKSSSFQCQPSSNARSQSRLAMSSTINSDLQSILSGEPVI